MIYLIGYGVPILILFIGGFILLVIWDKLKSFKKDIKPGEKRGMDKYINSKDYDK
jgi:hypothetical protein